MNFEQKNLLAEAEPLAAELSVICLCAEWCGTCRDYHSGFNGLAEHFPHVRFTWVDIEEHADVMGDLDVENFPTLLILRNELVLFFGTMLPHLGHLRRTIESFLEQTPEQSRAYAFSSPERRDWQANDDLDHLGRYAPFLINK